MILFVQAIRMRASNILTSKPFALIPAIAAWACCAIVNLLYWIVYQSCTDDFPMTLAHVIVSLSTTCCWYIAICSYAPDLATILCSLNPTAENICLTCSFATIMIASYCGHVTSCNILTTRSTALLSASQELNVTVTSAERHLRMTGGQIRTC